MITSWKKQSFRIYITRFYTRVVFYVNICQCYDILTWIYPAFKCQVAKILFSKALPITPIQTQSSYMIFHFELNNVAMQHEYQNLWKLDFVGNYEIYVIFNGCVHYHVIIMCVKIPLDAFREKFAFIFTSTYLNSNHVIRNLNMYNKLIDRLHFASYEFLSERIHLLIQYFRKAITCVAFYSSNFVDYFTLLSINRCIGICFI